MTYAELASLILKGTSLLRKLGLATGDGIAVLAENHPDSLALFWAAQSAGLYYTAISAQFQQAEVAHILQDCDARALVTTPSQAGKTEAAPQQIRLNLDDWRSVIDAETETLIDDAAEGAEMLYSS